MFYKDLTYTIQKERQRPWGFEVPLFVKGTDKKEHNIVMQFEKSSTEDAKNDMAIFWMDKILAEEDTFEERMFPESEVLEILRSKNIIDDMIKKLEDIPTTEVSD